MHKIAPTLLHSFKPKKLLHPRHPLKLRRTFLSKSYQCDEAWNKRFDSPLLKKVNAKEMFIDIDRKFNANQNVSAVDIDIFANTITEDDQLEEMRDLLDRLRLTSEASKILPSTHYAVTKFCLQTNKIETLIEMMEDRLTYGLFPSNVSYNCIMNHCIEKKDFTSAARTASLLMLQENFDHPISNALALYSVYKYLENPGEWKVEEIVKDEPVEEVKIRVDYLRNPYFDDHFDLREPKDLVGKTLVLFGRHLGGPEGRSCQLRGLLMYKKYEDAKALVEGWVKENLEDVVYKEVLNLIKKDNEEVFGGGEVGEDVKGLIAAISRLEKMRLKDGSLEGKLEENAKDAVGKCEEADIQEQQKNLIEWEERRMSILQEHLAELNRQDKKKQFAQIKEELEAKERILTFFDKEEEIELKIETKLKKEEEMKSKIRSKKLKVVEEYTPPEITKRAGKDF